MWSDCEWIGPDSNIFLIKYWVTGTISMSTSTVEVPREFPGSRLENLIRMGSGEASIDENLIAGRKVFTLTPTVQFFTAFEQM